MIEMSSTIHDIHYIQTDEIKDINNGNNFGIRPNHTIIPWTFSWLTSYTDYFTTLSSMPYYWSSYEDEYSAYTTESSESSEESSYNDDDYFELSTFDYGEEEDDDNNNDTHDNVLLEQSNFYSTRIALLNWISGVIDPLTLVPPLYCNNKDSIPVSIGNFTNI